MQQQNNLNSRFPPHATVRMSHVILQISVVQINDVFKNLKFAVDIFVLHKFGLAEEWNTVYCIVFCIPFMYWYNIFIHIMLMISSILPQCTWVYKENTTSIFSNIRHVTLKAIHTHKRTVQRATPLYMQLWKCFLFNLMCWVMHCQALSLLCLEFWLRVRSCRPGSEQSSRCLVSTKAAGQRGSTGSLSASPSLRHLLAPS